MPAEQIRTCTNCGRAKAASEFRRCSVTLSKDGLTKRCRACIETGILERRQARDQASGAQDPPADDFPEGATSFEAPASFGYRAAVDGGYVKIRQDGIDGRRDEVWLTPGEFESLITFARGKL